MNIFSQNPKEREFKLKEQSRIDIKPSSVEFGGTTKVFKLIPQKIREGKKLEIENESLAKKEVGKIEKSELIAIFNPMWNETYTHCIIDIIPQLMYLDEKSKYDKIFTCATDYLNKIVSGLDLKFKKVQFVSDPNIKFRSTRVEIFDKHPYARIRTKALIQPLKTHVDAIKVPQEKTKKFIFCSRNSKNESFENSQNRRTMHEEIERVVIELSKTFAEKNKLEFCIFNGSNENGTRVSVKEQLALFKNAKIIVAPHGGALANLIYVDKSSQCKVCEFTAGFHSEVQAVSRFGKNYNSLLGNLPETYLDYNLLPFEKDSKYNNKRIDLRDYLDFLESIKW